MAAALDRISAHMAAARSRQETAPCRRFGSGSSSGAALESLRLAAVDADMACGEKPVMYNMFPERAGCSSSISKDRHSALARVRERQAGRRHDFVEPDPLSLHEELLNGSSWPAVSSGSFADGLPESAACTLPSSKALDGLNGLQGLDFKQLQEVIRRELEASEADMDYHADLDSNPTPAHSSKPPKPPSPLRRSLPIPPQPSLGKDLESNPTPAHSSRPPKPPSPPRRSVAVPLQPPLGKEQSVQHHTAENEDLSASAPSLRPTRPAPSSKGRSVIAALRQMRGDEERRRQRVSDVQAEAERARVSAVDSSEALPQNQHLEECAVPDNEQSQEREDMQVELVLQQRREQRRAARCSEVSSAENSPVAMEVTCIRAAVSEQQQQPSEVEISAVSPPLGKQQHIAQPDLASEERQSVEPLSSISPSSLQNAQAAQGGTTSWPPAGSMLKPLISWEALLLGDEQGDENEGEDLCSEIQIRDKSPERASRRKKSEAGSELQDERLSMASTASTFRPARSASSSPPCDATSFSPSCEDKCIEEELERLVPERTSTVDVSAVATEMIAVTASQAPQKLSSDEMAVAANCVELAATVQSQEEMPASALKAAASCIESRAIVSAQAPEKPLTVASSKELIQEKLPTRVLGVAPSSPLAVSTVQVSPDKLKLEAAGPDSTDASDELLTVVSSQELTQERLPVCALEVATSGASARSIVQVPHDDLKLEAASADSTDASDELLTVKSSQQLTQEHVPVCALEVATSSASARSIVQAPHDSLKLEAASADSTDASDELSTVVSSQQLTQEHLLACALEVATSSASARSSTQAPHDNLKSEAASADSADTALEERSQMLNKLPAEASEAPENGLTEKIPISASGTTGNDPHAALASKEKEGASDPKTLSATTEAPSGPEAVSAMPAQEEAVGPTPEELALAALHRRQAARLAARGQVVVVLAQPASKVAALSSGATQALHPTAAHKQAGTTPQRHHEVAVTSATPTMLAMPVSPAAPATPVTPEAPTTLATLVAPAAPVSPAAPAPLMAFAALAAPEPLATPPVLAAPELSSASTDSANEGAAVDGHLFPALSEDDEPFPPAGGADCDELLAVVASLAEEPLLEGLLPTAVVGDSSSEPPSRPTTRRGSRSDLLSAASVLDVDSQEDASVSCASIGLPLPSSHDLCSMPPCDAEMVLGVDKSGSLESFGLHDETDSSGELNLLSDALLFKETGERELCDQTLESHDLYVILEEESFRACSPASSCASKCKVGLQGEPLSVGHAAKSEAAPSKQATLAGTPEATTCLTEECHPKQWLADFSSQPPTGDVISSSEDQTKCTRFPEGTNRSDADSSSAAERAAQDEAVDAPLGMAAFARQTGEQRAEQGAQQRVERTFQQHIEEDAPPSTRQNAQESVQQSAGQSSEERSGQSSQSKEEEEEEECAGQSLKSKEEQCAGETALQSADDSAEQNAALNAEAGTEHVTQEDHLSGAHRVPTPEVAGAASSKFADVPQFAAEDVSCASSSLHAETASSAEATPKDATATEADAEVPRPTQPRMLQQEVVEHATPAQTHPAISEAAEDEAAQEPEPVLQASELDDAEAQAPILRSTELGVEACASAAQRTSQQELAEPEVSNSTPAESREVAVRNAARSLAVLRAQARRTSEASAALRLQAAWRGSRCRWHLQSCNMVAPRRLRAVAPPSSNSTSGSKRRPSSDRRSARSRTPQQTRTEKEKTQPVEDVSEAGDNGKRHLPPEQARLLAKQRVRSARRSTPRGEPPPLVPSAPATAARSSSGSSSRRHTVAELLQKQAECRDGLPRLPITPRSSCTPAPRSGRTASSTASSSGRATSTPPPSEGQCARVSQQGASRRGVSAPRRSAQNAEHSAQPPGSSSARLPQAVTPRAPAASPRASPRLTPRESPRRSWG